MKIRAILFDLDGTLYRSPVVATKFAEAAYHALAKLKNIPVEHAAKLIEDKRESLKAEYGEPVPYTLTLKSFGMSVEQWHKENVAYFDPRDYLEPDERLQESLTRLKKQYRLAVLTNNNIIQAERILQALAIRDLFDHVFTYNSFKLLKPDPEFVRRAVEVLDVKPDECCIVGDRYNVDLIPAQSLGMQVYKVKGPDDIYILHETLVP